MRKTSVVFFSKAFLLDLKESIFFKKHFGKCPEKAITLSKHYILILRRRSVFFYRHYISLLFHLSQLPHFIYFLFAALTLRRTERVNEGNEISVSFELFRTSATRFDKLIMQECVKKRSTRFLQVECAFAAKYEDEKSQRSVAAHRTLRGL